MSRRVSPARLILATVAVAALALAGCGGTDEVTPDQFSADLQERANAGAPADEPVLPEPVATCLTDKVFEEYDQGEVDRIYRAATPSELEDDVQATLAAINAECFEDLAPVVDEGDDNAEPTPAEDPPTTDAEGG